MWRLSKLQFGCRPDVIVMSSVFEQPNTTCGPFKNLTMIEFFDEWHAEVEGKDQVAGDVISAIFSTTFILPFIFILL